ncbi:nitrate/nitrite transporter [Paenibacillus aurantius]|uniref:Nitrate/nitrite transporter n=1 Tax=Paenibacillus aurantius TaxID=2918900 RepID=A0AA96LEX6_9BACL|nr:nitrate/nitrite transporter [Paenibacillus aurantius]WNQ12804.1 nitrate/nitrite transporter [Paenibacillus aurantius]
MDAKAFRKAGHWPSLVSAFLYFDVSFMIWVMLGALSLFVTKDFGLTASQKALMVAIPTLGGSIFRIPMGVLADRIGSRRTGMIGMGLTVLPLLWGWLGGTTLNQVHAFGFLLGIAGASFAVSLSLASRWYPPEYQGLAMGIAGAGNSGTALATFFGPKLAEAYGWHSVFGMALIPLLLVFGVYALMAKDSPNQPPAKKLKDYLNMFRFADTWWFCFFYSITFGGFVGFSTYLSIFFFDQYGEAVVAGGLTKVQVGYIVTAVVIAGSFFRPLGGYLADRVGGMKLLVVLFGLISVQLLLLSTLPSRYLALLLFIGMMMCLGMGNGSIFQIVPQRFPKEIGVVTGVVGAAGGLGGFVLPFALGSLKETTGSFSTGFLLAGCFVFAASLLFYLRSLNWKKTWAAAGSGVNY